MQLIKKLQPQPAKPVNRKKRRAKGVAAELARKAERARGGAISSSSESDSDDLDSSEAESLLAEDEEYRAPPKPPQQPRYTPFIEKLFGGKLASVIVCEQCRGITRIEEDFLDISLPIKADDGKVRRVNVLFLANASWLTHTSPAR